jgi:ubiquinone/menaquinone biosynthesis C-methylase UbiE
MDEKNSYKSAIPYWTYCKYSNEKRLLHQYIEHNLTKKPSAILDIGCGNGINTVFVANRFPNTIIDAIERSKAQINEAKLRNNATNINYINVDLEHFTSIKTYDFILCSHVLQYIDSNLEQFVKSATTLLDGQGELWFIQQTKEGMTQIINHQMPYLSNPRFKNWKVFEDYRVSIESILGKDYQLCADYLDSSISQINFKNPSEDDKLRLEFILCLDESFDEQSAQFKKHLSKLRLGDGNGISHPNGILKIKRLK